MRQEARFTGLRLTEDGIYTVQVLAVDRAGQEGEVAVGKVTVLARGPTTAVPGSFCAGFETDDGGQSRLRIGWDGVFAGFGCEAVNSDNSACARFFADVGRHEHGRDVAHAGGDAGTNVPYIVVKARDLVKTRDLTTVDMSVNYYVTLTAVGASGVPTTVSWSTSDAKQPCSRR